MPLMAASTQEVQERLARDLNILIVIVSKAWGGLEQTALSDARLLTQQGFRVTMLISPNSTVDRVIKDESPQINIEYAPEKVRNYFDPGLIRIIRYLVDKEGVNLIHCHQTTILGSVVPALFRRNHVALVVSRHILNSHRKKDPVHALIYRRVDYILVLSRTMKINLKNTFPVEEKKLRTVNLGIDLSRFNPGMHDKAAMRARWNIPKAAFLVGIVGRIDPMKGQDLLIKAIAQARLKIPTLHGLIVGNETPGLDGEYLAELSSSIEQLRLTNEITILEAQKDIPEVMAMLDLFVMPSWSEAFGLVALEAMAMCVPCILSRAGSAEEIANNSGNALFRPKDAFDLAQKIMELYQNPTRRKEMGQRGREFVHANHSKQFRLNKTLEIYARCFRRRISK